MTLGDIVNQYLNEHDISMRELARRTGLSVQSISNIVRGVNSHGSTLSATIDTYMRLAYAMGLDLSELLAKDETIILTESPARKALFEAIEGMNEEQLMNAVKVIEALK